MKKSNESSNFDKSQKKKVKKPPGSINDNERRSYREPESSIYDDNERRSCRLSIKTPKSK